MSALLIHDSGRAGKLNVVLNAIGHGQATGMILSPFETPPDTIPRRPAAIEVIDAVRGAGGEVWMDPATYGALTPGATRIAVYGQWTLWPGGRNLQETALLEHVGAVVNVQGRLDLTPIAPTISIASAESRYADTALAMAERALQTDDRSYLSITGPTSFWTSGAALDAFVGSLVQLRPQGWFVAITRDSISYPPASLDPVEVAGICRTIRSLSMRGAPVIAGYGDLGGLPSVAAGATRIGTGGDLKQRCCAEASFRDAPEPRRPSTRVTFRELMASLKRPEAERLEAGDVAVSRRLVPGPLPPSDRNSAWQHHFRCLSELVDRVASAGNAQDRASRLARMYDQALLDWADATPLARPLDAGARDWIDPLREGFTVYVQDEGWPI